MSFLRITRKSLRNSSPLSGFLKNFQKLSMAYRNFVSVEETSSTEYAVLFLNKPPVNSFNLEFINEITAAIKDLESKNYRGFILSSKCAKTFSAGLDIKELYDPETERFKLMWTAFQEMWKTLYLTPLVTIAAINGNAPAAGCMLALSCDYRIMTKSEGMIGINAVHLGIVVPQWIQKLLLQTVGFHNTEKSLELGILYKPEQALALNFVDELVESPSDLLSSARRKMDQYLSVNDVARRRTKIGLRKPLINELQSYEKQELVETMNFFQADETKTILSSYMEKLKSRKH